MQNKSPFDIKKQITLREASEAYGIPLWTLRSYVSRRKIPHRKIGHRVYLTKKFEAWLESKDIEPLRKGGDK